MKNNKYKQFRENEHKICDELMTKYGFYCFDEEEFLQGLKKLGLTPETAKGKLHRISNGAYCLKKEYPKFVNAFDKLTNQRKKFLKGKKNLITALIYEFGNHECQISHRWDEATEVLGINYTKNTPRKKKSIIQRAKRKFWSLCIKNDWF